MSLLAFGLLAPAACERKQAAPPKAGGQKPAATGSRPAQSDLARIRDFLRQGPGPVAARLPPDHPPLNQAPPSRPVLPGDHPPGGSRANRPLRLKYDLPQSWRAEPPSNPMRRAQYLLPRVPGDQEDGRMVLFYFGPGSGGALQQNLERWRGMFSTPTGEPVSAEAVRQETLEVSGLKVALLEVCGTYDPATMPGAGRPARRKPGYRMLAAMVEGPGGPWFFKGVGPDRTMAAHRQEFRQLLQSLHR